MSEERALLAEMVERLLGDALRSSDPRTATRSVGTVRARIQPATVTASANWFGW